MSFRPTTRDEHIHVRRRVGNLEKHDEVIGYPVLGFEFEEDQYQDAIILVDGEKTTLAEFERTLPGNKRADFIPFPTNNCCEMQYGHD